MRATHDEQLDTVQEAGSLRHKNELARENYAMTSFFLAVYRKDDRIKEGNTFYNFRDGFCFMEPVRLLIFFFIVGVYFTALYRALASSRMRLLDHTQRRATVGRTPLNK